MRRDVINKNAKQTRDPNAGASDATVLLSECDFDHEVPVGVERHRWSAGRTLPIHHRSHRSPPE